MLSFQCKQTEPVVFRKPIEKYLFELDGAKSKKAKKQISSEHENDITILEKSRNVAKNAELGSLEEGLNSISKYYHFLKSIETKIPINESQVRIAFTWHDTVRKGKKATRYDTAIDLAAILFNHAALSSQIGASMDRGTIDGLKASAKYFQNAAGGLAACRELVSQRGLGPLTVDLSVEALTMIELAMLAQAQHCFCEKAIRDGMKEGILAKLCQGSIDLFSGALHQFQNQQIATNYNKNWSALLEMHVHHYTAKLHHHLGKEAQEREEYGVVISHLKKAFAEIQQAKIYAKSANAADILNSFLSNIENSIHKDLAQIEKDNNLIYNAPVPDVSKLPRVQGKALVKATPLETLLILPEESEYPFRSLLPSAAVSLIQKYKTDVEELESKQVEEISKQTNIAKGVLAELNLAVLFDDSGTEIPTAIQEGIKKINEQGGLSHVQSLFGEVIAMSNQNKDLLRQIEAGIEAEASQDAKMRIDFPHMKDRITESNKINGNLKATTQGFVQKLKAAASADDLVQQKMQKYRPTFEMIALGVEKLREKCPSSAKDSSGNSESVKAVNIARDAFKKLENVLEKREELSKKLHQAIEKTEIEKEILQNPSKPHTEIIDASIHSFDPILEEIKENISQQEEYISILMEATPKARAGQTEATQKREEFLQTVNVGVNAFREVSENVQEGLSWHSRFQEALNAHLQRVTEFSSSRRMEKQLFAESLSKEFAGMTVSAVPDPK